MNSTLVNCEYCNGVGSNPDEEYEQVDCKDCEGTGYVEKEVDGCVCAAREPFECCCGGWDDVDLDEWYGDETPSWQYQQTSLGESNDWEVMEEGEEY